MQGFVKLAEGVDVLPLKMAVERQVGVFGEAPSVVLYDGKEWLAEFFAFPQLRALLLDVMRRVECGNLLNVALVKMGAIDPIGPLFEASQSIFMISLDDAIVQGVGPFRVGDVLWASGATAVSFITGEADAFAVIVKFDAIP